MGLSELVGLTQIKRLAAIAMRSSIARRKPMAHTLLYGIGGTGKTSIARAIGDDLGYNFVEIEGGILQNRTDIINCLAHNCAEANKLKLPLLLFIDEVHRLPRKLQEVFYLPMREFRVSSEFGWVQFPPFSLFAATTRRDMLDEHSFVQRFTNQWEVGRYDLVHIEEIITIVLDEYGLTFFDEHVKSIGGRCLGVPRIATNLAEKLRDVVLSRGRREIIDDDLVLLFDLDGIDSNGLTRLHRRYLSVLDASSSYRGISSIASQLSQPQSLLEDLIEPILCELRLVEHGPRGRSITDRGRSYLRSAMWS
jgi:holliday junction DNA helicase RuvB